MKKEIKVWVVKWFGEIQPVGVKIPSLYVSKKAAQQDFQGEKIKIIPCKITYET